MKLRISRQPTTATTTPGLASAVRRRPCDHPGCPQTIQAPATALDEMIDLHNRLAHGGQQAGR